MQNRRNRSLFVHLSALTLLAGCGGAQPTPTTTVDEPPRETAPAPTSAAELVSLLETLAASDPAALDAHVDHAFAERLPSGDELASLFATPPEGCVPSLAEGPGYAVIAIPPPMDDDGAEETQRIEAIIAELQASTEVVAGCQIVEEIDGESSPRDVWLYAIAVRQGDDGVFRAMAWRDLRSESGL